MKQAQHAAGALVIAPCHQVARDAQEALRLVAHQVKGGLVAGQARRQQAGGIVKRVQPQVFRKPGRRFLLAAQAREQHAPERAGLEVVRVLDQRLVRKGQRLCPFAPARRDGG